MASILESLSQFATPELIGQASKMLGMDEQAVSKGLGVAGPLLLSAMGNRAATPTGAASLFDTLAKPESSDLLGALGSGDIGGILKAAMSGGLSGDSLANSLFGAGRQVVEGAVKEKFGIDIGPILALAAPVVVGFLSKAIKEQGLNASGLAGLLKTETKQLAETNPGLSGFLSETLDAGNQVVERAVRTRGRFSDGEWTSLAGAPIMVGATVMAAAPSGVVGVTQEIAALTKAILAGSQGAQPDSLLGVLGDTLKAQADQLTHGGAALDDIKRHLETGAPGGVDACRQVQTILDTKAAPEDARSYKQWLMNVATSVAGASKEGGFLGIGGQQVSAQEQAALREIATALGVAA